MSKPLVLYPEETPRGFSLLVKSEYKHYPYTSSNLISAHFDGLAKLINEDSLFIEEMPLF